MTARSETEGAPAAQHLLTLRDEGAKLVELFETPGAVIVRVRISDCNGALLSSESRTVPAPNGFKMDIGEEVAILRVPEPRRFFGARERRYYF